MSTRRPQQPAATVRTHLHWLFAAGMTRKAICADANISRETIYQILSGKQPHVKAGTAAVLFAVKPRIAAENGFVPALGAIRRARALVAFGYTAREIARRAELSEREVLYLLNGDRTKIRLSVWNRIATVFERLSATPGPSNVARGKGLVNRWAVPAAWDDIDNPNGRPRCQSVRPLPHYTSAASKRRHSERKAA